MQKHSGLDPRLEVPDLEATALGYDHEVRLGNCDDKTPKSEALSKQRSKNGYIARVGFDTLDCEDTVQYALTLQARTDKWKRAKNTRTFLVCTDLSDYSSHALQWVMENMVEDGDEIVALRVVPMELRDSLVH
ncbi:hypothetical protein BX616_007070 [Lobosporangium transversale]|nr:hypothetical protein BX616_007070 [Lobosporangium transversale]